MNTVQGKPRLIIICGLPGSGKTTLANSLAISTQAVRMSPDEWILALGLDLHNEELRAKIEELQWKQTQQLLSRGLTVIIEWGTWGRSERDRLRLGAQAVGARVELRYLSQPLEVLHQRLAVRGEEQPPITQEDLQRWSDQFEEPTMQELALYEAPEAL